MTGRVLHFDIIKLEGLITGDDGQRYSFVNTEWRETDVPAKGAHVDFVVESGKAISIFLTAESQVSKSSNATDKVLDSVAGIVKHEIEVPFAGESVSECELAKWLVPNKAMVKRGEIVASLETDKIEMGVEAPYDGVLIHGVDEGKKVKIGAVIGSVDAEEGAVKVARDTNKDVLNDVHDVDRPWQDENAHDPLKVFLWVIAVVFIALGVIKVCDFFKW